jgi:hypothetical protein
MADETVSFPKELREFVSALVTEKLSEAKTSEFWQNHEPPKNFAHESMRGQTFYVPLNSRSSVFAQCAQKIAEYYATPEADRPPAIDVDRRGNGELLAELLLDAGLPVKKVYSA